MNYYLFRDLFLERNAPVYSCIFRIVGSKNKNTVVYSSFYRSISVGNIYENLISVILDYIGRSGEGESLFIPFDIVKF